MQNVDAIKLEFQAATQEFLNKPENQKALKELKTHRFSVNLDALRKFNPRLENFVKRTPIDAIKMFEDQINSTLKGMADEK